VLAVLSIALIAWRPFVAPQPASDEPAGGLPLSFVPNAGQTHPQVKYTAQGAGYAFHFTDDKAVVALTEGKRGVALHLTPLGASRDARLVAGDRQAGKVNYITSAVRKTGLPTYGTITYRELWPGIDMVFRGRGGTLKYEFHVAPGADPSRIRLAYRGADGLAIGATGNLLVGTPFGTLRDARPQSYQPVTGGNAAPVASRYDLRSATTYGFALGSYDSSRPLVIDPGLTYSTLLGGGGAEEGFGIAVDASGNAYTTGETVSTDFPTTPGVFDTTKDSGADVFVTKLNPGGSAPVYSTFVGGNGSDAGIAIALDSSGNAYVAGETQFGGVGGSNFPTTAGAPDTTYTGANEVVVFKLNSIGTALVYSTFLGGFQAENAGGIAVDSSGQAYVTGDTRSGDFPVLAGGLDTTHNGDVDVYVAKLNSAGTALVYSTFVGGSGGDTATAIDIDSAGAAYVAGYATSSAYPTIGGSFDTSFNGGVSDGVVTKLAPSGGAIDYSTFLGGSGEDKLFGVQVDSSGSAYAAGYNGSPNFPVTVGAFDTTDNALIDVNVTKLNATGSALAYSTYIGGSNVDISLAIAIDAGGNAYVTGSTSSTDYPVSVGAFDATLNDVDGFVTRVNAAGTALVHSTLVGAGGYDEGNGIAVDGSGNPYITGEAAANYPTTAGAFDATFGGVTDAFATKLNMAPPAGFVRPKSASPLRVSLVPAFAACTAPNRVHGPPDLPGGANPDGSCNLPAQQSSAVTVGAPDANTKPANSSGFVKAVVISGDVSTAADEADVQLTASFTDVRNTGSLTDYTGELLARLDLRITDRFNGPTKGDAATTSALALGVPLTCTATPGPADIGGSCSTSTTADAILAGAVRENLRSVWELGQVEVFDGGADGDVDTTPNTVFARQGIFVP
jgi:hypothetical protein